MEQLKAKVYPATTEFMSEVQGLLSVVEYSHFNNEKYIIFPGFCDVHVHFRQPGFCYKETIKTGSLAAAKGGYTAVCTMPNLNPVPDSLEGLRAQTDIIKTDACINVYPYGAITKGEDGKTLSDMEALAPEVIGFSDDGRGVQSEEIMLAAMKTAAALGKPIVAHCEVNELLKGGYIHEGVYALAYGHRGICSESEWKQIERDIALVKQTGVKYHVCHISTAESVELIRKAKSEGVDITCETAPHYLILTDEDLREEGRFKMNPPLRSVRDRAALIQGVLDGTIDCIATDHAPHSAEEKAKGLAGSVFGITGIETAFALMNTYLVKTGIITYEKLVELMCINPRRRFNITAPSGFSVWDTEKEHVLTKESLISMGKATPFEGETLYGECLLTVLNGKIVYKSDKKSV